MLKSAACCDAAKPQDRDPAATCLVALAGPPNVGKSTLFNRLTGLSQHVGNWPGKTVEQCSGIVQHNGQRIELVDLPGTYSLTANSTEEQIARDFIIQQQPDVVVAVLNAANLERTLYLVAELLELPSPVVIALNMMDVSTSEGMVVEPDVLEAALGIPVVPLVATRGQGLRDLLDAVEGVVLDLRWKEAKRPQLGERLEQVIGDLANLLDGDRDTDQSTLRVYRPRWLALKLLEGDAEITTLVGRHLSKECWSQVASLLRHHEDAVVAIAGARYQWIDRMARAAFKRPKVGVVSVTERIDSVATHQYGGPALLLAMLGLLFWVVYRVSTPIVGLLGTGVQAASDWLTQAMGWAPPLASGFVVGGLLTGVGTVLSLVPILAVFFVVMGFLEDVGYMARAAFVADKLMHRIGLHGKSVLPLFLGFGCNVPATMGARILESGRARLLTILLTPFMPCSARMAVLVFFTGAIFGDRGPFVTWGLVVFSLAIMALSGLLIHRLMLGGESPAFIMEMPLYHVPNWRTIGLATQHRLIAFAGRAGTLILFVSAIVWGLSTLPTGQIESSYMAMVGRALEPLGALIGVDWRMMVSLLTSFVAKETAIATVGVLTSVDKDALTTVLPRILTPAAALGYLVTQMLFIPCMATVATLKQETGSWRWTAFSLVYHTVIAFGLGSAVYQLAVLFGLGG